jgi:hypothetical protein
MRGPDADAKDLGYLGDPCELRRHQLDRAYRCSRMKPVVSCHFRTIVADNCHYMKEVSQMPTVIEPISDEVSDG